MKRHIFAFALSMLIAGSGLVLPLVAYASGTASMDVSLTLTEDDVTPPNEPEYSGPDFVVNIPASISLNNQTEVMLTWENYNLVENYNGMGVDVYIDGAKTFPDGAFYLLKGDGSTEEQRIICTIKRTHESLPYSHSTSGPDDVPVARFVIGSQYPISLGILQFQTAANFFGKETGTYTGTIHFKIEVTGE
jgi:hypothetical protein